MIGVAVLVGALSVTLLVGTALAQEPGPWSPQGDFGWGHGPGMMGGGMMGGHRGMMGGYGYASPTVGSRLTLDQADEAVEQYLTAYGGDSNLALGEVMEFSNGFYAQTVEEETGIGASELLIDPVTGAVYPEPGPNMMWNTKYGHMGGWGGMMSW